MPDEIPKSGDLEMNSSLAAVWTLEEFRNRLELVRDLYLEVSDRDHGWDEDEDPDPWRDPLDENKKQLKTPRRSHDPIEEEGPQLHDHIDWFMGEQSHQQL